MTDKLELAKRVYDKAHITGKFVLRSGQISNEYFDKYLFEADPVVLADIAELMKDNIPEQTDVLAGLETGGIPVATVLSCKTKIPAAFVRKKAKEYGTCKLAEGADIDGKRVCVIEDVVTTGGQIIESVKELRQRGALVSDVLCVILRNTEAYGVMEKQGLKLTPLFTMVKENGISRLE
ncbi:MAG: orotate phosphoribosyltransferase [Clostridiales bacterium]|jgi:orotate phosphoribosyltransferase|nr:orotate phosphoribosyltransferase [Clostridiales bacterium]